ncbi:MAG TPA: hypothetical protein VHZ50_02140, partial [Puia sp.]|nr:hypothetical protein [Puia sp.]
MKKKIQRPENWQDFESLCKMLWGEIWECSEIQKNGRSGQSQNGVDVCGIPKNENGYFGIQCKGKDDFSNANLSFDEINLELDKAKKFTPPLKKFYFATTAKKDVNIEEYIRNKNLEYKSQGLFEVHLFAWDDITDLIYENRNTFNSYLNDAKFISQYNIDLNFQNNLKVLECYPEFYEYHISHHNYNLFKELGIELNLPEPDLSLVNPLERSHYKKELMEYQRKGLQEDNDKQKSDPQPLKHYSPIQFPMNSAKSVKNKSISTFNLNLKNTGTE